MNNVLLNAVLIFICLSITPALSCSAPHSSDQEKFSAAKRIFAARIVATTLLQEVHESEIFEVVKELEKLRTYADQDK